MARFNAEGIEGLLLSMEEFEKIPDGVVEDILMAGGEVLAKGHSESLRSHGLVKTGKLSGAIKVHSKAGGASNGFNRHVLIYPDGPHHTYNKRSRSYTKHNWGRKGKTKTTSGGSAVATNNDVGFVHEFGGHGNEATQWMREANEKNADKAVDAEEKAYHQWLDSLNL